MKVLILTAGTRGDIQPCLALGDALRVGGHEAVLVCWNWTPGPGGDGNHSVDRYVEVGESNTPEKARAVAARISHGGISGLWARAALVRRMRPVMARTLDEIWAVAAEGADLVVHLPGIMVGQHIAERLRVPAVVMSFSPMYVPTRDFANPLTPRWAPVPRVLNRATYALTPLLLAPYLGTISGWRRRALGLRSRRGQHNPLRWPDGRSAPVLGAYSPQVVPVPSEAPPYLHTTGYWLGAVPADWEPSSELTRFVTRGEPPIYVGFSSTHMSAHHAWRTILAAIGQARVRAVIATGSAGDFIGNDREDIYVTDGVPHTWLFSRAAAIVHHGGAGTAAAAVVAGRPQVICPFSFDQPFWAAQMHRLGVADVAMPVRRHTADTLATAIRRAVNDARLKGNAEDLSRLVTAENGLSAAVKILEKVYRDCSI